ncbi:MAG: hypothetical protein V4651_01530 [Bacteroidota bacterium]
MYTRGILVLLISTFVISCSDSKSDEENIDLGYNYFPTQVGATWIYDVDSLIYDDNTGQTTIDTVTYQYKEQITGVYKDVTGETAQLISRYYRYSDTLPWTVLNQSTQMLTALNAQRVQENTRYVKLVFPLAKNKTWNGNLYNALDAAPYKVSYLDEQLIVGNTSYPLTVKVQQKNEENAVKEIIRYEVYARNVGLVYSLSDSLDTQYTLSGDPLTRGYRYRFTLVSYTP